jgi:hypothetical protein
MRSRLLLEAVKMQGFEIDWNGTAGDRYRVAPNVGRAAPTGWRISRTKSACYAGPKTRVGPAQLVSSAHLRAYWSLEAHEG